MKIKIAKKPKSEAKKLEKKLDKLFSSYKRFLSGGYCKKCGKYFGYKKLHNAHFHSRRKHSVRWDISNSAPLCYGCHSYIDGNPLGKIEFFLEILGKEEFEALNVRAESLVKVDKEKIKSDFEEKLKEAQE